MNQNQLDKLKTLHQELYKACTNNFLHFDDLSIKNKLILAYGIKVVEETHALFNDYSNCPASLSSHLQIYLKINWNLISGTMLSYTALPGSKVTFFLCSIAQEIVRYKNSQLSKDETPISDMEILFPNVNLESDNDEFPHLCVVRHEGLSQEEQFELLQFQKELAKQTLLSRPDQIDFSGSLEDESSERAKKEKYDSLQTIRLSHPKIYKARIAKLQLNEELLLKLAQLDRANRYQYLLNRQDRFKKFQVQEQLKQIEVNGPFIIPKLDIIEVLKTHIQSYYKGSLIPVSTVLNPQVLPYRDKQTDEEESELLELKLNLTKLDSQMHHLKAESTNLEFAHLLEESVEKNNSYQRLINQFNLIRKNEQERLAEHSSLTKSYCDAKEMVERLKKNKNSLLGHLIELCKNLRHYDAHEGIGTQENAGIGVYEPIRIFSEYYRTLGYHMADHKDNKELAPFEIEVKVKLGSEDPQDFIIYCSVLNSVGKKQSTIIRKWDFPILLDRISVLNKRNKELKSNGKKEIKIDDILLFQELFSMQKELIIKLYEKKFINLEQEEKGKIPIVLRHKIESLLELSQNPEKNINATINIATCIGTIREALDPLISRHSVLLASINTSAYYLVSQLERAEEELTQRAFLLKETLKEQKYKGKDSLPLTQTLLKRLQITIGINNLDTLNDLMDLNIDEIKELLENEVRVQEITKLFSNQEELFDFVFEHPSHKIFALFEVAGRALFNKLCTTYHKCINLLFGQNDSHTKVILRALLLYSSVFDLPRYLQQNREKLALVNEILSDKVDAALAWSNNPVIPSYVPHFSGDFCYFRKSSTLIKNFFHIDAKRAAIESLFKRDESLKEAYDKEAQLFGLFGTAKNSKEQVFQALKKSPLAIKYASGSLQRNQLIKEISTTTDDSIREFICDCFLNLEDAEYINALINSRPILFSSLPEALRDNEVIVLAGIKTGWPILDFASERFQKNKTLQDISLIFAKELRTKACDCYKHQKDIKYVAKEVLKDPNLFRFLTVELRKEEYLVLLALGEDQYILSYTSPEYQNNVFLKKIAGIRDRELRRQASWCYLNRHNIDYLIAEVLKNYKVFTYLVPELYDEMRIIVAALYTNRDALKGASKRLQNDPYLKSIASLIDQELRSKVCYCFLKAHDIECVVREVKNNKEIYKYLPAELKVHPQITSEVQVIDFPEVKPKNRYSFLQEMQVILSKTKELSPVEASLMYP